MHARPHPFFQGKSALITGASSGIGLETAQLFARRGAKVLLCARSLPKLERAAETIRRAGGTALAFKMDVTSPTDVQNAVHTAVGRFGRLDILVNNAGLGYRGPLASMPLSQIEKLLAVNFLGVIHCVQAALPILQAQRSGQIINVSSVIGKRAVPGHALYCATKFALNGLTEALRVEVAPFGIRVILVCPSVTDTPFAEHSGSDGSLPMRKGKPPAMRAEKVARAIVKASLKARRDVVLSVAAKSVLLANALAPRVVDWGMRLWWQRLRTHPAPEPPA